MSINLKTTKSSDIKLFKQIKELWNLTNSLKTKNWIYLGLIEIVQKPIVKGKERILVENDSSSRINLNERRSKC